MRNISFLTTKFHKKAIYTAKTRIFYSLAYAMYITEYQPITSMLKFVKSRTL